MDRPVPFWRRPRSWWGWDVRGQVLELVIAIAVVLLLAGLDRRLDGQGAGSDWRAVGRGGSASPRSPVRRVKK